MRDYGLERKFCSFEGPVTVKDDLAIEGYASLFGKSDNSGDAVAEGAYARSLDALRASGRRVKMLWQHDPCQPIGVWDEVREDAAGLYVKGRLLPEVGRAQEAAALVAAGAIDGLSIGYRTIRATKDKAGRRRLEELELWEVSLVTFPMLSEARVRAKDDTTSSDGAMREIAGLIEDMRRKLRPGTA